MNPRARLLSVAAVLAIGAVVAFAVTQQKTEGPPLGSPTARPTLTSNCVKLKPAIDAPSWYPDDLPMPDGSYVMEVLPEASGLRRVIFAARGDLRAFVIHALGVWKQEGWTLGRGEAEPGEAEDNFLKGDRYGIFRAQEVMCDPKWTWVLVVLNDPKVKSAPTPGFNRKDPNVKPSTLQT